jgi:RNA polymerase sigma factor (sigma-70 family)
MTTIAAGSTTASARWEASFRDERRFLFGLCYRMTGCAADAEDLVQQTFARALESPPPRLDEPLRPWLVRVAMNLSRDHLRRRRHRAYVGPWLPSPIETEGEEAASYEPTAFGGSTENRYDLLESVSYAFLLALEALTPQQRAVLLLRDVFDYSVREVADALTLTEQNVKTTHHRARKAMSDYEGARCVPTAELSRKTRAVLESFLGGLVQQDVAAVEKLLLSDVRALSDGGGEYLAARVPVFGASKVALMYVKLSRRAEPVVLAEVRELNGLPAVVIAFASAPDGLARRFVLRCDVDQEGRIVALHSVMATRKLTHVRFAS